MSVSRHEMLSTILSAVIHPADTPRRLGSLATDSAEWICRGFELSHEEQATPERVFRAAVGGLKCQPSADLGKVCLGSTTHHWCIETADKLMPQHPDGDVRVP
ncbi:hypothetical protein DL239_19650 [Sedimentitalea sp. CY04]|uniref:Uncharacterized protein n=1 Tax=Parasedimentitalea denitrificans TaxID=2211118 RepID=A0ABX0WEF3_9RHOB|nr:hypothetical protein [Sedimentitalea sp. CY04]